MLCTFLFPGRQRANNAPAPLNLRPSNTSSFFPDGRPPVSPIDHPPSAQIFQYGGGYKFQNSRELRDIPQTFSFGNKSPISEQDSGSTSGIHTMEEIPTPRLHGNVV